MEEEGEETINSLELVALQGNESQCNATNATANRTNITFFPYYQHSLPVAASFIFAYLFIFLLCMLGNILVCLIVLRDHRMRTVTNLFILNLAVSDLLVGIFCIPTTLVDNLITGWPFTNMVCKMSGLIQGTSVSASVFTLVAIAVDRFRCIVYPFQPKITLLVAKATIAMIWVLAVVIMCPSAAMLTVQRVENHYMVHEENYNRTYPLYTCYENWPEPGMRRVYTMVLFGHIYLVPLMLITLMYSRIGVKLYTSSVLTCAEPRDMVSARASTPEGRPVSQRKIRVIKMLIVVALLFMLSWLPLWTLMLLTDYGGLEGDQLELITGYIFPFAHWLAFSNSSVNPIIYGYYNENFKRGFQVFCQPHSCCQGSREGREQSLGDGREERGGSQDAVTNGNPLTFGMRNRVHTDGDPTKCVRLELEWRKSVAVSDPAHGDKGQTRAGSLAAGVANRRGLCTEEGERIGGAGVCQAWDL
ncbi:neuropeptide FF receptor 1 like 2 [Paramormyrops kingsleyae]|uniref:neuropeptide FF receptor 1 like 2 n=1 Tax=Paramormyrops kingsleyae TaxID=1676925 RepID=UPI003B972389